MSKKNILRIFTLFLKYYNVYNIYVKYLNKHGMYGRNVTYSIPPQSWLIGQFIFDETYTEYVRKHSNLSLVDLQFKWLRILELYDKRRLEFKNLLKNGFNISYYNCDSRKNNI